MNNDYIDANIDNEKVNKIEKLETCNCFRTWKSFCSSLSTAGMGGNMRIVSFTNLKSIFFEFHNFRILVSYYFLLSLAGQHQIMRFQA